MDIVKGAAAALLVGALGFGAAQQVGAQATPAPAPGSAFYGLSVIGEATVRTVPDLARVTLGVELVDASSAAAEQEATRRMEAVAQRLAAAGVAEGQRRTVAYALAPQQEWQDGRPGPIRGYHVTHLVEAEADPARVGALIDAATAAGANRVVGVTFDVRDPRAAEAQAREQAVGDARRRAEALARAGGTRLDRLTYVEELAVDRPVGPAAAGTGEQGAMARISPGEQQLRLIVRAGWSLGE